jgi:hypothetical protein
VDYVSVDPSVARFWSIEWWSYEPESRFNYLIWGIRRQMHGGDLLDWDNPAQEFTAYMEKLQKASVAAGHPIRYWVVEAISANRHLLQTDSSKRWRRRWPQVPVIPHKTHGQNKLDPAKGVQVLSMRQKTGMKRLPPHGWLGAGRPRVPAGSESRRSDSNRRPAVYKTAALPLSYAGALTCGNVVQGWRHRPYSR